MRKIVINTCYGGFSLSEEATGMFAARKNIRPDEVWYWDIPRDDADLIHVVEFLGGDMGSGTKLKIVEIPADVDWEIVEYDGLEHVAEKHCTWY